MWQKIEHMLTPYSMQLVLLLTNDEDVKVLKTLKSKLSAISDSKVKDDVLIIKLCDRIDNLKKKYYTRKMDDNYLNKSNKLFNYILNNISDKYKSDVEKMIKHHINAYIRN